MTSRLTVTKKLLGVPEAVSMVVSLEIAMVNCRRRLSMRRVDSARKLAREQARDERKIMLGVILPRD